jgi:very-short-patch-repair endonuclease
MQRPARAVVAGCETCGVVGRFQKSSFCERCFREKENIAPDYRKLKETLIVDLIHRFLVQFDPQIEIRINRKVDNGNAIPDIFFQYMGVVVIIEIDENQHRSYKADPQRTTKLRKQFKALRILRINPDRTSTSKVPMIDKQHRQEAYGSETQIQYYTGEIERRSDKICAAIGHILSQIVTDTCIGELESFAEFRLFFD